MASASRALLLCAAIIAAVTLMSATTVSANHISNRCPSTYNKNYCYRNNRPYCGDAGLWHYDKCGYSGGGSSNRCRTNYDKSRCEYGTPYCRYKNNQYYWDYSTCRKYQCEGYPDFDLCPYGGLPYCGYDSEAKEYYWSYDKCSKCDLSRANYYKNYCDGKNMGYYCGYNSSSKSYNWTCSNRRCTSDNEPDCGEPHDDYVYYAYCRSNGKWKCQKYKYNLDK